jgi:DME family drug/metabolite transporter
LLAELTNTTEALGLAAATVAAMFWAIAVVLYRRVGRVMPPVRLNLTKGLFATVVMGAAVLIGWQFMGHTPWSMSAGMLVVMALSGVIGIGLGDTLLFAALNRMGRGGCCCCSRRTRCSRRSRRG